MGKNTKTHGDYTKISMGQWKKSKGHQKKKTTLILWKQKHNTLKSEIQEKQFCVQTLHLKETRKTSDKQVTYHLKKELEKEEKQSPKVSITK